LTDSLDFLRSLEVLGMKFGLENMRTLCAAMGHPENSFRSVIVAGTNGKGSVTAMVSAALHAAGYHAARYTSPHLQRLEERFVIGEREVETGELRDAAAAVQAAVEDLLRRGRFEAPPTFFECTTATAFELFRRAGVDVAVLEVGLGGRLDATNVVLPLVAAITSIDLDHQAQLGTTVREIAQEKAGVIKPGVPVVIGPLPAEADAVVADACRARGAGLIRAGTDEQVRARVDPGGTTVTIQSPRRTLHDVRLALQGRHQAVNAAIAVAVLDEMAPLGFAVDDEGVRAGLERARWAGRLERFQAGGCDVLLDAAHNPAGVRALAEYLGEIGWTRITLVFGAMRDKDVRGMLEPLLPICHLLICTTAASPRAVAATDIAALAAGLTAGRSAIAVAPDPAAALGRAQQEGYPIVAAGSIFLIGPLRGILR
jgi:dihydrofolate synthase/folylpolyglutamate synthase